MKQKFIHLSLFLLVATMLVGAVSFAGSLTPPGSPSKTMKSLSDLYQLINTGSNTPANDFTTPGTVSSTMNSLGDIYDLMTTKIAAIDTTKILTGTSIFGKAGSASAGGLPKTGQTTCYNGAGNVVSCASTGQDGDYLSGLPTSGAHFTDNSNGTISDNATGLMWKKCTEGRSGSDCSVGDAYPGMAWSTAITTCEADTTAGYTNWRLPNRFELESILDLENPSLVPGVGAAINLTFFPSTVDDYYWTSSTYANVSGNLYQAWYVDFYSGQTQGRNKANFLEVRCVR